MSSFTSIEQPRAACSVLLGLVMSLATTLLPNSLAAVTTTEIVVIGTAREIVALPADYHAGHLRLMLANFNPDLLAVEAPLNATDPLRVAPLEIAEVVKPWADERFKKIVPIGWNQEQFASETAQALQELQASSQSSKYLAVEQQFQRTRSNFPLTAQAVNSDGFHQVWREYHRSIHELLGRETPWEKWNSKIVENLLKVVDQNPNKRIAVVIGAAHVYYLLDALEKHPGVNLVRLDGQFPLDPSLVDKATLPIDVLRALIPLNSDLLPPSELKRLEGLLEKLKALPESRNDYYLLRGKYLLHVRQPLEALKEFEQLGSLDRNSMSQLDGKTRLYEAGLAYSALALLQSGDVEAARARIKTALEDPGLSESARAWVHQLSNKLPPAQ